MSYRPTRDNFDRLFARHVWLYGLPYAIDVAKGRDAATNADLAAWRALGGPKRRLNVVRR